MNVLLIEDEQKIADFVMAGFSEAGFRMRHESDGFRGLNTALITPFDALILDVMLPVMNGFEILAELRRRGNSTPVIMLSALHELPDKLKGFDLGANDYLAKPFHVEELMVRVRKIAQTQIGKAAQLIEHKGVSLDRFTRKVSWQGNTATLTQREYELLELLMLSPGQIFSRERILERVWNVNFETGTNTVDVCIQRIRKKLAHAEAQYPQSFPIETIRSVGYRFSAH